MIYGRRRVGKTRLVKEVFKDEAVYFFVEVKRSETLLGEFSRKIARGFSAADTISSRNFLKKPGWLYSTSFRISIRLIGAFYFSTSNWKEEEKIQDKRLLLQLLLSPDIQVERFGGILPGKIGAGFVQKFLKLHGAGI